MASIDEHFPDTSGFEQLQSTVAHLTADIAKVAWRGTNYQVAFN
ncbi:hypothetical protein [Cognaticolwellia aestuarii]|nr:hypothetical protein [Cognaticolwellia aestuarii]